MDLNTWMTVLTVGILVVLSPGPNWAITIKNSIHSREAGIFTVFGMATGTLIHIFYCLIGIGVIISQSILLFNIVKWAGAIYLIYLGAKSLVTKKTDPSNWNAPQKKALTARGSFFSGLFTDLLNPKATLFYLALFTQVIHPETPTMAQVLYGITVLTVEMIWYSLMVCFLTHQWIRRQFLSISHWIERITGAVLFALGVRLAFSKANNG